VIEYFITKANVRSPSLSEYIISIFVKRNECHIMTIKDDLE
jgi:hypothetical protein